MNKLLGKVRYSALIAVLASFTGALLMLLVGAIKVIKVILLYFTGQSNMIEVDGKMVIMPHRSKKMVS